MRYKVMARSIWNPDYFDEYSGIRNETKDEAKEELARANKNVFVIEAYIMGEDE